MARKTASLVSVRYDSFFVIAIDYSSYPCYLIDICLMLDVDGKTDIGAESETVIEREEEVANEN